MRKCHRCSCARWTRAFRNVLCTHTLQAPLDIHITFGPSSDILATAYVHFVALQQPLGNPKPPIGATRPNKQVQMHLARRMGLQKSNSLKYFDALVPMSFDNEFSECVSKEVIRSLNALCLNCLCRRVRHADPIDILACYPLALLQWSCQRQVWFRHALPPPRTSKWQS